MDRDAFWRAASAVELIVAFTAIVLDLFIPTLVILAIAGLTLVARGNGIRSLGFKKVDRPLRMVLMVLALVVVWTLLLLGVVMPVLSHLTGTTQDLSGFDGLQGNLGSLAFLLLLSWTLAALGEEIVYRGYLQARTREVVGAPILGVAIAIIVTSVMFGLAHTEQGIIGVVVTGLDAVFFSLVKLRFDDNLWAAVLAHGFSNSIGLIAFFFVGPIYGFW